MLSDGQDISFFSHKIKTQNQITEIISSLKKTGKKIGLCVGSYDLLHPGHIKHFESAKDYCDYLIVGITADNFVKKRKGNNRPIISENLRAYSISQLSSVDYVFISPFEHATNLIYSLKPSLYIKGSDYVNKDTKGITAERKAISDVSGEMKYTYTEKFSTTQLIRKIQKKSDKPILVMTSGIVNISNVSLLETFAERYNFCYIDKVVIEEFFLKNIRDESLSESNDNSNILKYLLEYKNKLNLLMLKLAETNLTIGLNVIINGYPNDEINQKLINDFLSGLSKKYHVLTIYFTLSKKTFFRIVKENNYIKGLGKIIDFKEYLKVINKMDFSNFDIIFNIDDDNLQISIDSLSHEIMNNVYKRSDLDD